MLNTTQKNIIENFLLSNKDDVFSTRHHLHCYPELSGKEFETAKYIEKQLDSFGIKHERVGDTGVYAVIDSGKPGKTMMLRADIDALPITEQNDVPYKSKNNGVMHACGHDAHTTALLTACKFLAEHKDLYNGKVKICFQQGEEIGLGARVFLNKGYIKEADRCFGLHVTPNIPTGKIIIKKGVNNAAVDWFKVKVTGKAVHVSTPEIGVDALYIACNIVNTLQAVITRKTNPVDSALIGIGKLNAGTAYNIVAGYAEFEGTIRSLNENTRKLIKSKIEQVSTSIAESFGGKVEFEWNDNTSVLSNDPTATADVQEFAFDLFGKENIITEVDPSLGGDDMAEFIIRIPGTYCYVGSQNPKDGSSTNIAQHNEHFNIDDDCLLIASKLLIGETLDFLK